MIEIKSFPPQVAVRQTFEVVGTTSPDFFGRTIELTIDNQIRTEGGLIEADGTWRFRTAFLQPGDRRLTFSIENHSVTINIRVMAVSSRLRFTQVPREVEAEVPFQIAGEARGYADNEELLVTVDGDIEVARPVIRNEQWRATLLFHQSGRRQIMVFASDQDRIETTIIVRPSPSLSIVSRQVWGARPARRTTPLTPTRITLHHSASPPEPAVGQAAEIRRMRQIQNSHMDGRGWSDIGYHYVIMASGRVYEGRPERVRGSHDEINDGLGVCFDGNYTTRTINNAQFQAAVALCTRLCRRIGIEDPTTPVPTRTVTFGTRSLPPILGHRDRDRTACPGTAGGRTVRLEDIRQAVRTELNR